MTTSPVPHLRQHPAFRSWWLALGVSNIGTWMQVIGLSLLALRLPGSGALNLGTVSLVQAIAFGVFSLGGGVITDRFPPAEFCSSPSRWAYCWR
ncbi:MFS transporter (plasmid) [Deinococcus sp. KNUC1210]|uniref:MFS transporter n=1 Tax=Deinococcus sp. KNUC1210 TaxID=2917691 RepID=UPI001EEFC96C|nr:MFS transporter [Deinococcus sp. KNUC1210]ULH17838.1 MFS transporter [Deinococcus sp. KNUC1210]